MSPVRGVAIVLSAAALCAPVAALGQGSSGAGDDQYDDPFSEEATGTGSSGSGSSGSTGGLTEEPDLGTGSTSSGTTTVSPTTSGTESTATGSLPNTGADPRLAILAGLALLLSGLGLRLRTADEIF